mmetsp:Transcript_8719/g.13957  ORF Transcript_8719/g.13957 Transcript_8719/m.13957 type:complete len:90 (+) Transcript_8719:1-270(+)
MQQIPQKQYETRYVEKTEYLTEYVDRPSGPPIWVEDRPIAQTAQNSQGIQQSQPATLQRAPPVANLDAPRPLPPPPQAPKAAIPTWMTV